MIGSGIRRGPARRGTGVDPRRNEIHSRGAPFSWGGSVQVGRRGDVSRDGLFTREHCHWGRGASWDRDRNRDRKSTSVAPLNLPGPFFPVCGGEWESEGYMRMYDFGATEKASRVYRCGFRFWSLLPRSPRIDVSRVSVVLFLFWFVCFEFHTRPDVDRFVG